MNEKLQKAETDLLELLVRKPEGLTMDEILKEFIDTTAEAELRAAVWTLRASGDVDFDAGKLKATVALTH